MATVDWKARTAERARFMSDTCNRLIEAGKMEAAAVCLRGAVHLNPELAYTPEFSALVSGPLGEFIEGAPDDTFATPVDSPEFRAAVSATLRELYPEAAAELDRYNPEVH